MKKIIYALVLILLCFAVDVNASSLSFSFEKKGDNLLLEVIYEDKVISYDDAITRFNLEKYIQLRYNNEDVYFYMGKEISENEYNVGNAEEVADNEAEKSDFNIRVKDTKDFINAVKKIYDKKKVGIYSLIYTKYEYEKFDIDKIKRYYEDNILTDLDVNMYKFDDYGILFPTRYVPIIEEEGTIINFTNVMITDEELFKVKDFMKYFVTLFNGKSDYEKVLGVYNYIKETTKYKEDNGYDNTLDAHLSPYDAIFKKSIVCIGASTTMQYMLENLGVESFIVDRVEKIEKSESLFFTSHTYNVVNLNNTWYIVDITSQDGFLKGMNKEYRNDTYSKKIYINDKDYLDEYKNSDTTFEFDYKAINKVIDRINDVESEDKENTEIKTTKKVEVDKKNDDENKYIILSLVLVIIFLVIVIFSRKK